MSRQPPGKEYASVLTRVDLFAGLDRVTLAKLAAYFEVVPVEAGTTVVEQGGPMARRIVSTPWDPARPSARWPC